MRQTPRPTRLPPGTVVGILASITLVLILALSISPSPSRIHLSCSPDDPASHAGLIVSNAGAVAVLCLLDAVHRETDAGWISTRPTDAGISNVSIIVPPGASMSLDLGTGTPTSAGRKRLEFRCYEAARGFAAIVDRNRLRGFPWWIFYRFTSRGGIHFVDTNNVETPFNGRQFSASVDLLSVAAPPRRGTP